LCFRSASRAGLPADWRPKPGSLTLKKTPSDPDFLLADLSLKNAPAELSVVIARRNRLLAAQAISEYEECESESRQ
jgi:hypothetical protein